ncbi:ANTAR domain-containing protein [Streptomyces apricus]|uniref:ANTAR domain-containing protein n=2 Tax=Streptomyces apricus TaxID=1828112 RepID=A0A5A9ZTB3_9ACTN|nr:ANTAR domain-containing protein [Streptomyces apricus]KAA0920544.1 ANTAR domain-containing protein [Streptomyces apricus]
MPKPHEPHPQKLQELQEQNAQLHQAVRSHAVVDQAIGVVIALSRVTPEAGWNILKETSQHTNIKLRHVAELVVEWARTGQLPSDIRTELERRLAHAQPPQTHE